MKYQVFQVFASRLHSESRKKEMKQVSSKKLYFMSQSGGRPAIYASILSQKRIHCHQKRGDSHYPSQRRFKKSVFQNKKITGTAYSQKPQKQKSLSLLI